MGGSAAPDAARPATASRRPRVVALIDGEHYPPVVRFAREQLAAIMQEKHQPILKRDLGGFRIDWARLAIVFAILAAAIAANVVINLFATTNPLVSSGGVSPQWMNMPKRS